MERNKHVVEASNKHVKGTQRHKRKTWMTDKILQLMDERRKWKNKDPIKYKRNHKMIQKEIKKSKRRLDERTV